MEKGEKPPTLAIYDAKKIDSLLQSAAVAAVLNRSTTVVWREADQNTVARVLYGMAFWKARPGTTEVMTPNLDSLRAESKSYFQSLRREFYQRLSRDPGDACGWLNQKALTRDRHLMEFRRTFLESQQVNQQTERQINDFLWFLFEVKCVAEIALAVVGCLPVGAGTAVALSFRALPKFLQLTQAQKWAVAGCRFVIPVIYSYANTQIQISNRSRADIAAVTMATASKAVPDLVNEQVVASEVDLVAQQCDDAAEATARQAIELDRAARQRQQQIAARGSKSPAQSVAHGRQVWQSIQQSHAQSQAAQQQAMRLTSRARFIRGGAAGLSTVLSGLSIYFFSQSVRESSQDLVKSMEQL
jgi:hypothetical protein